MKKDTFSKNITPLKKIYIYCIISHDSDAAAYITDVSMSSRKVFFIKYKDVAAVVSEIETVGTMDTQVENYAVIHEEICELLMENYTVLPMRLMTIAMGNEGVLRILEEHYSALQENIKRLSQKVEFGIKVLWPATKIKKQINLVIEKERCRKEELVAGESFQKVYMKKKLDLHRNEKAFWEEAEKYITQIDDFISVFAVEKKLKKLQTEKLLLNAAYLVKKDMQKELTQAFKKLRIIQPDLEYQFSGPWPPYNFIKMKNNQIPDQDSTIFNFLNTILTK